MQGKFAPGTFELLCLEQNFMVQGFVKNVRGSYGC